MTAVRPAALAVTLVASALLAGCVTPAPTTSAYESKAGRTAQAAVSEVRTAVVAEKTYAGGGMTRAYLETVVGAAEEALGSVRTTFDSIQPPATPGADALRAALDPLLEKADASLRDLRIAVRRDDGGALATAATDLGSVADSLDAFAQEHPA